MFSRSYQYTLDWLLFPSMETLSEEGGHEILEALFDDHSVEESNLSGEVLSDNEHGDEWRVSMDIGNEGEEAVYSRSPDLDDHDSNKLDGDACCRDTTQGIDLEDVLKRAKIAASRVLGTAGVPDDKSALYKEKNRKKRRSESSKVDVHRFVAEACKRLQEQKVVLMWNLLHQVGFDVVCGLLKEVEAIESCGGQMTADGKRRRTPGGVLWNIVRSRVAPEVYKSIMSSDKQVQKQKEKNRIRNKRRRAVAGAANKGGVGEGLASAAPAAAAEAHACNHEDVHMHHQAKKPHLGEAQLAISCMPTQGQVAGWHNAWAKAVELAGGNDVDDAGGPVHLPGGSSMQQEETEEGPEELEGGDQCAQVPAERRSVKERLRVPLKYREENEEREKEEEADGDGREEGEV